MRKTLAGLALLGTLALAGCDEPSPSDDSKSITKILKSNDKSAILTSVPKIRGSLIDETTLYLNYGDNKITLLKRKGLVTSIEIGDLNMDGTDDFILSYREFKGRRVNKTGTEKYLSQNNSFVYSKIE